MAQSSNAEVVRNFYAAIAGSDAAAIGSLIADRFAPDATFVWPASLPYGGQISGAARLSKVFMGMAASPVPVGPSDLAVVRIVDGGDSVVAELTFTWHAPGSDETIESGALECWTFDGSLVSEVAAFYWDTAACRDLVQSTQASA